MNKIVLIPDSFKGTMASTEICAIMREQIRKYYPEANVVSIPVADGGEGSVDCFLQAAPGKKETVKVKNPFFEDMQGFYGLIDNGKTAVVEMAACAGLPLVEDRKDPMKATTYGVGELILDAAQKGVKKIIVGLGGSATNDGGCGAACAAGVKFYNESGESFIPTGGTLTKIERIDVSGRDKTLNHITDLRQLTPEIVREFIDHIVVHHAEKMQGERVQKIEIYYNCIGAFEAPSMEDLPRPQIKLDTRKGVAISYSHAS